MKAAWVPLGSWLPRGISSDLQWQRDEAPLARAGGPVGGECDGLDKGNRRATLAEVVLAASLELSETVD